METNLTDEQMKELRDAFAMVDREGMGSIGNKELGQVLRALGQFSTESDLYNIIYEADADGSGEIGFLEFAQMMASHMAFEMTDEKLKGCFKVFDQDGDGFISMSELRTIMRNLGEAISDDDFEDMVNEIDENRDGKISLQEFMNVIKHG